MRLPLTSRVWFRDVTFLPLDDTCRLKSPGNERWWQAIFDISRPVCAGYEQCWKDTFDVGRTIEAIDDMVGPCWTFAYRCVQAADKNSSPHLMSANHFVKAEGNGGHTTFGWSLCVVQRWCGQATPDVVWPLCAHQKRSRQAMPDVGWPLC